MDDDVERFGVFDNPLGKRTFDEMKFKTFYIDRTILSFEEITEKVKTSTLDEITGSRVHWWRVLLGLVTSQNSPKEWVEQINVQRKQYYEINEKYSIKNTKKLNPKLYNPLITGKDNLWNELLEDKDLKDSIYKDVVRTHQDYKFFYRNEIRNQMVSQLYLWAKTYPLFSYRQGMNEILAMVYFAFQAEKSELNEDIDKKDSSEIAGDFNLLIQFLFNEKHIVADIFIVFNKIMNMGIKELYGTIEDITSIRTQLSESKTNFKDKFFASKQEQEKEEKKMRVKIEKLYDEERKKSAVIRRWNRIYHNFLKRIDTEIYNHLVNVELDPELQLMRWLRWILSREFSLDIAMNIWDFIFTGIQDCHRVDKDFGDIYYTENYYESTDDPLINLDYLWLAMIEYISNNLNHEDLGTWLEVFFNYPKIDNAAKFIFMASKIEKVITFNSQSGSEFMKIPIIFEPSISELLDVKVKTHKSEPLAKESTDINEETKDWRQVTSAHKNNLDINHENSSRNKLITQLHTEELKHNHSTKHIAEKGYHK